MSAKHTPGPWHRIDRTVYALNDQQINRFWAVVQDAHTPDDELLANARLIAAAPDLLAALKDMLPETPRASRRRARPLSNAKPLALPSPRRRATCERESHAGAVDRHNKPARIPVSNTGATRKPKAPWRHLRCYAMGVDSDAF